MAPSGRKATQAGILAGAPTRSVPCAALAQGGVEVSGSDHAPWGFHGLSRWIDPEGAIAASDVSPRNTVVCGTDPTYSKERCIDLPSVMSLLGLEASSSVPHYALYV